MHGVGVALSPFPEAVGGPAEQGEFNPMVDVWLSAGPTSGSTSWDAVRREKRCGQGNTRSCRIYRLSLNLGARTGTATVALDMTGVGVGLIQPAVDRSGERLAVIADYGWDYSNHWAKEVALLSFPAGRELALRPFVSAGGQRPAKPEFWTRDQLLWSANAQGDLKPGSEAWWANLHLSDPEVPMSDTLLLGGRDGSSNQSVPKAPCAIAGLWPSADCVSWRDPAVHQHPSAMASTDRGPWVTVFGHHGLDPTADTNKSKPLVAMLPDGDRIREFNLGTDRNGDAMDSCHHPAWNVSGSSILCTREIKEDQITAPPFGIHGLYGFEFVGDSAGGTWENRGEVVPSGDVRLDPNLTAFAGLPIDTSKGAKMPILNYKYGHWCGSDRFVVATVFVTQGGSEKVLMSRVVLFDTWGVLDPWDLIDLVEDTEGAQRGTWQGASSTCRS